MRYAKINQIVMYLGKECVVTQVYDDFMHDMCTIKFGNDLCCVAISKLVSRFAKGNT